MLLGNWRFVRLRAVQESFRRRAGWSRFVPVRARQRHRGSAGLYRASLLVLVALAAAAGL